MAYYGTIVGKKALTENLIGQMHTHHTEYIPYPEYTGEYMATPTSSVQTFATEDKLMVADFVVDKTPYSEVSNIYGGFTATIL